MFKNKIYKYFTIEILKSFATILFAFTIIAWTVRSVNFLDLIVENGHSIKTYLSFSILNISNIITKFIPLSFLLALTLSIIKFERQNEFIILWTIGLNKMKVVNLFFLVSILILIIQLAFAVFITPNTLNKSRDLIRSSNFDSMNSVTKSNDFSDSFKSITFYVESKNEDNEMKNIFIRDETDTFKNLISQKDDSSNTTILAKSGFIDKKKLFLFDGIIQSQDSAGQIDNIIFKKTELAIDGLTPRVISVPKMQETSTSILLKCISNNNKDNNILFNCPKDGNIKNVVETLSRRIGMPIYIPVISLICSFLLITNRKRKLGFFSNYIYFILGFLVLILAEIMVRFSGFSFANTIIYFLFPLLLIPVIYLLLVKKLSYEKMKYE